MFLILKCPEVVTPLAYLILTGDTTLTLPPALQDTPPTRHRRDGSYSGIRGFVRPEASLATSLQKQRKKAKTKPVQVLDRIRISEDSNGGGSSQEEGSSTESQRHMTEAGVGVAGSKGGAEGRGFSESRERSGSSSLGDFVDVSIVDSQYVLIEPSSDSSRTSSIPEVFSIHYSLVPCASPGPPILSFRVLNIDSRKRWPGDEAILLCLYSQSSVYMTYAFAEYI